jgi:hypothetical protein
MQMGLRCINSTCECSNLSGQDYLDQLGTCVNSTMKLMFEDVVTLINQTELELEKFSTLLEIFMIHRGTENENETASAAAEVSDVKVSPKEILTQLEVLQGQIEAPKDLVSATELPIPTTSLPSGPPTSPLVPLSISSTTDMSQPPTLLRNTVESEISSEPTVQLQSPQTVVPVSIASPPTTRATPLAVTLQGTSSPSPISSTSTLPNSISDLIVRVPNLPAQEEGSNVGFLPNLPGNNNVEVQIQTGQGRQGPVGPGTLGIPNLTGTGSGIDRQLSNLANVLPQFLAMFKQFLPMLQSFNGILGSSLFSSNSNRNNQNSNFGNQVSSFASSFGQNLQGQQQQTSWSGFPNTPRPSLLQVPGRIFNRLFGRNSTLRTFKRRIIPFNLNNSYRPIPFLPFIG